MTLLWISSIEAFVMTNITGADGKLPLAARQMLLPITQSDHVIKYDTVIADGKHPTNGWSWQKKDLMKNRRID